MKTPTGTFKSGIGRLTFEQCSGNQIRITNTEKFQCQFKENKISKLRCMLNINDESFVLDATSLKITYSLTDAGTVAVPTKSHLSSIIREIQQGFMRYLNQVEPSMKSKFYAYTKFLKNDGIKIQISSKLDQIEQLIKEIRELHQ
jgi:Fe-S cluster assembly scaffold protein SufB